MKEDEFNQEFKGFLDKAEADGEMLLEQFPADFVALVQQSCRRSDERSWHFQRLCHMGGFFSREHRLCDVLPEDQGRIFVDQELRDYVSLNNKGKAFLKTLYRGWGISDQVIGDVSARVVFHLRAAWSFYRWHQLGEKNVALIFDRTTELYGRYKPGIETSDEWAAHVLSPFYKLWSETSEAMQEY